MLQRNGANPSIQTGATLLQAGGPYGGEAFVYQARATIANYHGAYPIIRSWMIDGVAAGIGFRESKPPITSNLSSFLPHLFA